MDRGGRPPGHQDQAFCRGEAWAVATLEDGTLAEPACSALAEYRWATFRLEVVLFLDGYWQEIAASAAAGGGGRSAQEEERLMLEGLVAEIELRHGVAVGSFAAVGPRRGQRVHVLDPYWDALRRLGPRTRRIPAHRAMPGTAASWLASCLASYACWVMRQPTSRV